MRRVLSIDDHVQGVLAGDRAVLGRTISLVESTRFEHRDKARQVLQSLLPHTGKAWRVGVSGPPGVGKSTFLEALGLQLVQAGHRVAVLAVDPSSERSGGSILGDKTRMGRLSVEPHAYVRPSPATGALGGVARATRAAIRVVEAAGYDVVLVETVGVGQSEVEVAAMVDCMLVLLLAGAGDELQGIKKGILEVADVLAINKADGDRAAAAARAARELRSALHLVRPRSEHWTPPVLTCSGLTGEGLAELWEAVVAHREVLVAHGELQARRAEQRLRWMWTLAREEVQRRFDAHPEVARAAAQVEAAVREDALSPSEAAERLISAWSGDGSAD